MKTTSSSFFAVCLAGALFLSPHWNMAHAQEAAESPTEQESADSEKFEDGPWLSAVRWQGNRRIVATKSQGLPLRPGAIVKAVAGKPENLSVVAESEKSLWSIVGLGKGKFVASDYSGGVQLYGDGKPKAFEADTRWIRSLINAPADSGSDSLQLLAGTEDGKLVVLSVAKMAETKRIDAHSSTIFSVAASNDGSKIATAASDGSIKVFSWPELEQVAQLKAADTVWTVAFSGDDTKLISGGSDRVIDLWDIATQQQVVTITKCGNWVTSLVALPKSTLVAAGSMDGVITIVDYASMHSVSRTPVVESAIWSLALSPNGKRLAVGSRKHGLKVVQAAKLVSTGKEASEKLNAIVPPSPTQP